MRYAIYILLILFWPTAALAQEVQDGAEEVATKPVELVAPYDDKLLRLSEILGSIHYLRALCGADEGNKWRASMSEIIIAEEPGPKRRAQLISRFNRGYRAFNSTYATCTPSALLAVDRYMKEGVLLSSQITGRYGR